MLDIEAFMYINLLIYSSCTIGGYQGDMNVLGLGVGHPYVPTTRLGGGPPGGSPSSDPPLNDLPLNECQGDPLPDYWCGIVVLSSWGGIFPP